MGIGAIIAAPSTAAPRRAILAVTPLLTMERTPILPVRGASIPIRSTAVRKPARPAAHRPMITRTIAILMEAGQNTMKRSIAERRLVLPAAMRVMSMATTGTPTRMASATIAAQPSR